MRSRRQPTQNKAKQALSVHPFGFGNETPIGKMYGVTIGCLKDIGKEELSQLPIT